MKENAKEQEGINLEELFKSCDELEEKLERFQDSREKVEECIEKVKEQQSYRDELVEIDGDKDGNE